MNGELVLERPAAHTVPARGAAEGLRAIHVLPSADDEASGPTYTVKALVEAQRRAGSLAVLAATGDPDAGDRNRVNFARRGLPARLGRSPELYRWLRRSVEEGIDIVHTHSLWMMPNVYPGWATRGSGVPLVVSPHGTLSRWSLRRSRLRKRVMWHLMQRGAIAGASLFHATCEDEYRDIRRAGFRQPVAVIANGVDMPPPPPSTGRGDRRTLLFLSRVHPKKGVDILLQAWAALEAEFPAWDLEIVGPAEPAYRSELERLAASLSLRRVAFLGPLYGPEKTQAYHAAELFVLPTHSENFAMVVAEALAAGRPVVTTRQAPWCGLGERNAGWWIETGVDPLRGALRQALAEAPEALAARGERGRRWMEEEYSWDTLAARMLAAYRWIGSGDPPPPWVRHD